MTRIVFLGLLLACIGPAQASGFELDVNAANASGHMRNRFVYDASGCRGDNVAPALRWHGAPSGTRGYAITVYDPDARDGWWHWIVLDIAPITTHLAEGAALPPGSFALRNSFGHAHWDGPCPPMQDAPHHYQFTIYALDTPALGLPADASPEQARSALTHHTLAKARVTYTYGRAGAAASSRADPSR